MSCAGGVTQISPSISRTLSLLPCDWQLRLPRVDCSLITRSRRMVTVLLILYNISSISYLIGRLSWYISRDLPLYRLRSRIEKAPFAPMVWYGTNLGSLSSCRGPRGEFIPLLSKQTGWLENKTGSRITRYSYSPSQSRAYKSRGFEWRLLELALAW